MMKTPVLLTAAQLDALLFFAETHRNSKQPAALESAIEALCEAKQRAVTTQEDIGAAADNILSARERACLLRLKDGKPTKVIAREMDIPHGTVRHYLRTAYRKLGVHNRMQAAAHPVVQA